MPSLIAIGNTFIDCILMPDGGVHPFVCGGNALYIAAGMNLWSSEVAVLSRIGKDYPEKFLEDIAAAGIDISGIRRLPGPHVLVSGYLYHEDGSRDFFWPDLEKLNFDKTDPSPKNIQHAKNEPVGFTDFDPILADIPEHYWNAKGFCIGSMGAKTQLAFVQALSRERKIMVLDSPDPTGDESTIIPWVSKTTAFIPSREDMNWFFDEYVAGAELEKFAELGAPVAGLKLGAQGSLIMDVTNHQIWHIPPLPVTVKDPTGAGDAYCGGFLAGYLETGDVLQAAMMATVSSSAVIEGFDVRFSLHYDRRDALKRLNALRSMVKQIG